MQSADFWRQCCRRLLFGLGVCILSPGAQAELYRCVKQYGIVAFSDSPCGNQAQILDMPSAPKVGTALDPGYREDLFYQFSDQAKAAQAQREAEKAAEAEARGHCETDSRLWEWARFSRIELCMTQAMVRSGESSTEDGDVLEWEDDSGRWERWRYRARRSDWPYIIVFHNGRVAQIVRDFDPYSIYEVPMDSQRPSLWPFRH